MENNPITVMYDEHALISTGEQVIKKIENLWETNTDKYKEIVTDLIFFFRNFADGVHHRKEEEVLFPAIKNHPDFVLQEIIGELELHHEDFREYATEIEEAIANGDYNKSHLKLQKYVSELLDHIAAENEELFVLAENLLDEEQLETIYFKFKDIDMEVGEKNKEEMKEHLQKWIRLLTE